MTLALVYERMKDYPKARDAYEKLLAIKPNFVPALNNLAYLYTERLNNLDKAYDLARKARELQGQDASVADTFGWVLYKRGDYQQALPILQESAQKAADNPEIQFHLGMTAYMMGQTDLARVAFRKAASAAKDFPGKDESKRRLALLESGTAPRRNCRFHNSRPWPKSSLTMSSSRCVWEKLTKNKAQRTRRPRLLSKR